MHYSKHSYCSVYARTRKLSWPMNQWTIYLMLTYYNLLTWRTVSNDCGFTCRCLYCSCTYCCPARCKCIVLRLLLVEADTRVKDVSTDVSMDMDEDSSCRNVWSLAPRMLYVFFAFFCDHWRFLGTVKLVTIRQKQQCRCLTLLCSCTNTFWWLLCVEDITAVIRIEYHCVTTYNWWSAKNMFW